MAYNQSIYIRYVFIYQYICKRYPTLDKTECFSFRTWYYNPKECLKWIAYVSKQSHPHNLPIDNVSLEEYVRKVYRKEDNNWKCHNSSITNCCMKKQELL